MKFVKKYMFLALFAFYSSISLIAQIQKTESKLVIKANKEFSYPIKGKTVSFSQDYSQIFIKFDKPVTQEKLNKFLKDHTGFAKPKSNLENESEISQHCILPINTSLYNNIKSVKEMIKALVNDGKNSDTNKLSVISAYPVLLCDGMSVYVDNTINVEVSHETNIEDIIHALKTKFNVKLNAQYDFKVKKICVIETDTSSIFQIVTFLNKDLSNQIHFAEPDFLISKVSTSAYVVNDPLHKEQWFPEKIHLSETWEITIGNPNTVIAVLDSKGFYLDQRDFNKNRCIEPWNYNNLNGDVTPETIWDILHAHGTATTGIINAKANNGIGVAGVGFNLTVMPWRIPLRFTHVSRELIVLHSLITFNKPPYDLVAVNCSFSYYNINENTVNILKSAYESAYRDGRNGKGLVFVASSGNEYKDEEQYPAAFDFVIAVGASNSMDYQWREISSVGSSDYEINEGSNYGEWVDMVAPGDAILLMDYLPVECQGNKTEYCPYYNEFVVATGTSYAAPIVSAIIGLMASVNPELDANQLAEIIQSTCDKVHDSYYIYKVTSAHRYGAWNPAMGYGRVNALKAVQMAQKGFSPIEMNDADCSAEVDLSSGKPLKVNCKVRKEDNKNYKRSYTFKLKILAQRDDKTIELSNETIDALNNHDETQIKRQYSMPRLKPGVWNIIFEASIEGYTMKVQKTLNVPEYRPDLTPINYNVEFLGENNSRPIHLKFKAKNQGYTASNSFYVSIYLREKGWENKDSYEEELLDSRSLSSIAPREFIDADWFIERNDNTRIEDWELTLRLDDSRENPNSQYTLGEGGDVSESSENNNCFTVPIHIPKYKVDLLLTEASASFGCINVDSVAFQYYYSVKNIGTSMAKYSWNNCWLENSKGERIFYFSVTNIENLFPQRDTVYTGNINLARKWFTERNVKAVFNIEYNNHLPEINENNNSKKINLTLYDIDVIPSDVKALLVNMPDEDAWRFNLMYNVENSGTQCTGDFIVKTYLKSTTFSDKINLESFEINLETGERRSFSYNITVPYKNVPPGKNYRLYVEVDPQNKVPEKKENNNISYSNELHVCGPDISIEGVRSMVQSMGNYRFIDTRFTIKNIGDQCSKPFNVSFQLKKNDESYSLGSYMITSGLKIRETQTISQMIKVSDKILNDNYDFKVIVDEENKITETVEANNTYTQKVSILPDLSIKQAGVEQDLIGDVKLVTITAEVSNIGTVKADSFRIKYFIYNGVDPQINLGTYLVKNGLNSQGSTGAISQIFTIPCDARGGNQYVFISVDSDNEIAESKEDNNIYWQTIVLPGPDIRVEAKGILPSAVKAGDKIMTRCMVGNYGNDSAIASNSLNYRRVNRLAYYLSKDINLDDCDVIIGYVDIGNLAASQVKDQWKVLSIPSNTVIGDYYVLFYADFFDAVREIDENNNVAFDKITIVDDSYKSQSITQNQVENIRCSVYPVPAKDMLTIEFEDSAIKEIELTNSLGQVMYIEHIPQNMVTYSRKIDVSRYVKGLYLLKIKTSSVTKEIKIVVD